MKKFLGSFENRAPGSSLQRGVCLKLRDCECSTPVTASVRVKAQLLMTAFSHHRLRMTDCKSLTSSITNRTVGTILVCFEYSLIKSQNLVFLYIFYVTTYTRNPVFTFSKLETRVWTKYSSLETQTQKPFFIFHRCCCWLKITCLMEMVISLTSDGTTTALPWCRPRLDRESSGPENAGPEYGRRTSDG